MSTIGSAAAVTGAASGAKPRARGLPRGPVAAALACAAFLPAAFGVGGVGLGWIMLAASLAVGVVVTSPAGHGGLLAAAPLGFLVLVLLFTVSGIVAGLIGLPIWSSHSTGLLCWGGTMGLAVAAAATRGGRINILGTDVAGGVVLLATWMMGVLVAATVPLAILVRDVGGSSDFGRHLLMMRDIAQGGFVDYSSLEYPRGVHGAIAALWSASGRGGFLHTWLGMQSVLWLMFSLLMSAAVVATTNVARRLGTNRVLSEVVGPLLTVIGILQGMWLTAMYVAGFFTSIMAGLALVVCVVEIFRRETPNLGRLLLVLLLAIVTLANAWTLLLPAVAVPWIIAAVTWWRARPPIRQRWFMAGLSLAAAIFVAVPVSALSVARGSDGSISDDFSAFGDSGLMTPAWWWVALLGLSIVAALVVSRRAPLSSLLWSVMTMVAALMVVALVLVTGGGWSHLSYYPLKTLWTSTILIVPLAVAGGLWGLNTGHRVAMRTRPRWLRLALVGVVAAASVSVVAGVAGWMSGYPSTVLTGAEHGLAPAPLEIAVIDSLERQGVRASIPDQPILVWGVSPYSLTETMAVTAGYPDWLSREASSWLGFEGQPGDRMPADLLNRDARHVCDFLRAHPNAVRVTGPNPAAGIPWLRDSGCPDEVIQPDKWIRVDISDEWFRDLSVYKQPYFYPTYQEFQDYKASRNQPTS